MPAPPMVGLKLDNPSYVTSPRKTEMNITFEVLTQARKNPGVSSGTFAAVPPALLSVLRGMSVTELNAVRLLAESIAKAALAACDRSLSSVNVVLSEGN